VTQSRTVVLVEGDSDRIALEALAARHEHARSEEGVEVVAMHGITNTRSFALRFGPRGLGLALVGLYDAPEVRRVQHGLAAAGLPMALEPGGLQRLGFFGCEADLEEELIRALGADRVEAVIDAAGEGASLRRLIGMPAQRGWSRERLLRRFFGSQSGRKARYARLLVEALEPGSAPAPLAALLASI
jgi:hypothetical protein